MNHEIDIKRIGARRAVVLRDVTLFMNWNKKRFENEKFNCSNRLIGLHFNRERSEHLEAYAEYATIWSFISRGSIQNSGSGFSIERSSKSICRQSCLVKLARSS